MITVKFYCVVMNNGDGSASAFYYADMKTAQDHCDLEELNGEAFSDNSPEEVTLKFDNKGKLLNPSKIPDCY